MSIRPRHIVLLLGLLFLYGPMILLIIYSFNASRLVTVWGGFSTEWYGKLLADEQMMGALLLSFQIAALAATAAVVLGTAAAFAITRYTRFPGKQVFGSLLTAPLMMPEVITGLSLLLLFVAIGLQRGMLTIWVAHTTFCLAYAAVVISARLRDVDRSLEEAARDLGAPPWKVFFLVTLPLIAPALIAAWLLAFTLSFDDLVVASFVAGPGASTLPMVIFSSVRLGVSPKVNALAAIIVVVITAGSLLAWWLLRRLERRRVPGVEARRL